MDTLENQCKSTFLDTMETEEKKISPKQLISISCASYNWGPLFLRRLQRKALHYYQESLPERQIAPLKGIGCEAEQANIHTQCNS